MCYGEHFGAYVSGVPNRDAFGLPPMTVAKRAVPTNQDSYGEGLDDAHQGIKLIISCRQSHNCGLVFACVSLDPNNWNQLVFSWERGFQYSLTKVWSLLESIRASHWFTIAGQVCRQSPFSPRRAAKWEQPQWPHHINKTDGTLISLLTNFVGEFGGQPVGLVTFWRGMTAQSDSLPEGRSMLEAAWNCST